MPTDRDATGHAPLRVALAGIVAAALLAGCAGGPAEDSPDAGHVAGQGTGDGAGQAAEPTAGSAATDDGASASPSKAPSTPSGTPGGTTPTTGAPSATGTDAPEEELVAGIEMPVEPAPSTDVLSELLEEQASTPLVTTPLPRAASANGRLVARFPELLRPTPATVVGSSSLSPSGERLVVALVGATSSSPADVLRTYRIRLASRGLTERRPPATVGGSQAAVFTRGLSAVTVTVTRAGPGTSYTVNAVLHTGRE